MEAAGRVSPEFVYQIFDRIDIDTVYKRGEMDQALSSMAKYNPQEAQRLLAQLPEGDISDSAPLYVIRALGKKNPAAALALAEKQQARYHPKALLEAAAFLPKEQARALLEKLFADENNHTVMNVAKANAIDPEFAKALYAKSKQQLETGSYDFTNHYNENGSTSEDRVQYAYLIASLDPLEARLILETEYALAQRKAEKDGNPSLLFFFPQAMCPLDLERAQEMLFAINGKHRELRTILQQRIMQYILMSREERVGASFY
jgi:predicted transcriptional regulator